MEELTRLESENAALLARLDQKDQAIRELCHELRNALAPLAARAQMIERYLERGDQAKAAHHAAALAERLRARKTVIDEAQGQALGV